MNIIVTMAGIGRRFRERGYDQPKYRIEVRGRTLFSWSVSSLWDFILHDARLIFVALERDKAADFIAAEAGSLGVRSFDIVELEEPTDGQATSALAAGPSIGSRDEPVAIYNIDTSVDPRWLPLAAVRGQGWIPTFPGSGTSWSFARASADGRIVELREKKRISNDATIGFYAFSSYGLYEDTYKTIYEKKGHLERGERYIAPMYNELIAGDMPVYLHRIPASAVVPLGTPGDVDAFVGSVE